MAGKKRGLGRGLDALLDPYVEAASEQRPSVLEVDIRSIDTNAQQPRKQFEEEALKELAASIATHGIVQPLIVKEQNGRYKIYSESRHKRHKYGDRPSVFSAILRLKRYFRLVLLTEKKGHGYSECIGNPHYCENIGQALPSFPL